MSESSARGARGAVVGGATRVRGKARQVIQPSGPPTVPISVRGSIDRVSEWHSRAVIDFCLRLGEAMLVTGASVADTTTALLRVCRAYGLTGVHVDITYTSVTLSMHRGVHRDPITVMRIISYFGTDYSRLEALHALVREIAADPEDPGDIEENVAQLEHILNLPNVYRRGIITMAWAAMGAAMAALFGGGIAMMIIAALTTTVIDRLNHRLARRGISAFFAQVLGATIAAGVAAVLLELHTVLPAIGWLGTVRPAVVVASSIVALLSGMSVVAAAQDTLDGFYLTAGARTYEVALMTGGIVLGVMFMLKSAKALGVTIDIVPGSDHAGTLFASVLASATFAGAYATTAYCAPRAVALATLTGAGSYFLYSLVLASEVSAPVASGVAAFAVGVLAPTAAGRLHVPSISLTTAGIMPLLPGIAVYRSIVYAIGGSAPWLPTALSAALIALALSVGVSLGTLLGRQLTVGADSLAAKVVRRTVAQTGE